MEDWELAEWEREREKLDRLPDLAEEAWEKPSLRLVDQIGGETRAVARFGRYLLAGVGFRLVVFQINRRGTLTAVGQSTPLGSLVERVAVHGRRAYVETELHLHLIDLTKVRQPRVVGQIDTAEYVDGAEFTSGIAAFGSCLYFASDDQLFVFDTSNPRQPRKLATITIKLPRPSDEGRRRRRLTASVNGLNGLFATEAYLYAATDAGLVVVSVVDPARPGITGVAPFGEEAQCLHVTETLALVGTERGFWTVDVSDPARPRPLGTFGTAGDIWNLAMDAERAYLVGDPGLFLVDVARADQPRILSQTGGFVFPVGVAISGGFAYVADNQGGISVVDCSDPTRPRHLPIAATTSNVSSVLFRDGYAYVVDDRHYLVEGPGTLYVAPGHFHAGKVGGVRVLDLGQPTRPARLAHERLAGTGWEMILAGAGAYVKSPYAMGYVDLGNLARPTWVGWVEGPTRSNRIRAVEGRAYLARDDGLLIADVTEPAKLRQIGLVPIAGGLVDLRVAGTLAYVVGGDQVYVVDVARAEEAAIVGTCKLGFEPEAIAVEEPYAYVSAPGVLIVVDLSDPRHPSKVKAFRSMSLPDAGNVCIAGHRAYITGTWSIMVVDLSDPARPVPLARTVLSDREDDPGMPVIRGEDIYVPCGNSGLLVFRL